MTPAEAIDTFGRLVCALCDNEDDVLDYVALALERQRAAVRPGARGWRAYRHDIGDYMQRVIMTAPNGTLRLHRILRSDAGDPHDHPWDFTSRILRGSYLETVPGSIAETCYGAGDVNRKRAEDLHRLTIADGPVVTLVRSGPVRRDWGFATADGWVHYKRYSQEARWA